MIIRGRCRYIIILISALIILFIVNWALSSKDVRQCRTPLHPNKSTIPFLWLKVSCVSYGVVYCIILLYHGHITADYVVFFFNGLLLVNIIVHVLKITVKRQRPDWQNETEPYESFPSGHTAFSMGWCMFMILLFKKKRNETAKKEQAETGADPSLNVKNSQNQRKSGKKKNNGEKRGRFSAQERLQSKKENCCLHGTTHIGEVPNTLKKNVTNHSLDARTNKDVTGSTVSGVNGTVLSSYKKLKSNGTALTNSETDASPDPQRAGKSQIFSDSKYSICPDYFTIDQEINIPGSGSQNKDDPKEIRTDKKNTTPKEKKENELECAHVQETDQKHVSGSKNENKNDLEIKSGNKNENREEIPRINQNIHNTVVPYDEESLFFLLFLYLMNLTYLMVPVIVGISRVLDRKHHITDVVAGALLGILIAGSIRIFYHKKIDNRPPILLHTRIKV